ncbi:MAG: hypothetical protein AB7F99_11575 [Vicinamibacterales bacterium]
MNVQDAAPIIVDIQEPPPNVAQDVVDILLGSVGVVGLIAVAAIVIGGALGFFMFWRKSRSDNPLGSDGPGRLTG